MNASAYPLTRDDAQVPPITPAFDTVFSSAFATMLPNLSHFIAAERDMGDISASYDPAYAAWFRDVARANAALDRSLMQLHQLPIQRPEDDPLCRMALLIDAMLNDDDPVWARQAHHHMHLVFFQRYQVAAFSEVAQHCNGLLIQARHLVDALIQLPLFDFSPECVITGDDAADADAPVDEQVFAF
ncbi:MAG: hypothetical protein II336_16380 [Loktanella sp.]|nr:hypothetical protein [Loktanella sp.]